jgi:hypothetical protein
MTLSVAIIVSLLMLVVLGYSFNQKDGKLEQGGLLQFESTPQGANVTLDEVLLGSQTNTKSTVDTGNHSVSYNRKGYRTWSKSIYITPGQIGWLSYARLIPTTITPKNVRSFTNLSGALASPERKYMLLSEHADQPVFLLADIQGDKVQYKDLTLPAESYTQPAAGKSQTFTIDRWSDDEQAVLIRHNYDDNQSEWILLDRDSPEKSINITTTFAVQPSKLIFAGTGNKLLFVQTDDIVRRINLDEQTLSRPLATHVANFNGYDEKTIAFTTTPDDKGQRTVGYAAVDIDEPQTIATYPSDNQPLYAAMESYFGHRYVSMLHGTELKIVMGTLPTPSQKANLKTFAKQTIPVGATNMIMTRNGRFVIVQLPDGYATYDIELTKYDKTTWDVQSTTPHDIRWLDDYMIWSDNGGTLRTYEFDGANQQNIMPVAEGYAAEISPNDKYIYGIGRTDKGFELKRALMILP